LMHHFLTHAFTFWPGQRCCCPSPRALLVGLIGTRSGTPPRSKAAKQVKVAASITANVKWSGTDANACFALYKCA
ncbi:hypothetical protein ACF8MD_26070, partial [Pseudomonas sp. zjy_8]